MQSSSRTPDLVVAACAISAGAHAALVPSHLDHELHLGVAFIVASVLLMGAGAALVYSPADPRAASFAALVFTGLIASYAATASVGIPVLSVEPEAIDGVALATKAVESVGLLFALKLTQTVGGHRSLTRQEVSQ